MCDKKSIIFCAPADYGLSESIKQALENERFTVLYFPIIDSRYKYKNLQERMINLFRKVVLRDYEYKHKLKMRYRFEELKINLQDIPDTDYALIIRPDLFPEEFVNIIKTKTKKLTGYQWDGLERFPAIFDYIDLFDRFFVFDSNDIEKHPKNLPLTNFYIPKQYKIVYSKQAYFLGSYDKYRFNLTKQIKSILEKINYTTNFLFVTNDKREKKILSDTNFKTPKALDYRQNIENVESSSLVIDIHVPIHSGLSFRVFEALYYNKKLITTNEAVKNYDFYHPNNIFIWNESNEDELIKFLDLEYIEIEENIIEKYSFKNWISYILENGDYIPIELPVNSLNTI